MKGMVHIGPGTYAHLSSHRSPVMTVVEKQTAFAGIMYSENLLRYESIKFKMLSPTVQFWRGMRPFARHSQETSRLVVHDVQEWITLRRLGVDVNGAYIGVLGVEVDQVHSISITLDVQLEARTVYEISRKHPLVSALRYRTSYAEEGEKFFFAFSTEVKGWTEIISMPGVEAKYEVKTGEAKVHKPYVLLGSINTDAGSVSTGVAYLQTPRGSEKWSLTTPLRRWLFVTYFRFQGKEGWRAKVAPEMQGRKTDDEFVREFVGKNSLTDLYQSLVEKQSSHVLMDWDLSPLSWKIGKYTIQELGEQLQKLPGKKRLKITLVRFCDAMDLPPPSV